MRAVRHANQLNLKLYNGLSRIIMYQVNHSTTHDAALASSVMESSSLVNVSSRTVSRTRFLSDVTVAPSAALAVKLCYPPPQRTITALTRVTGVAAVTATANVIVVIITEVHMYRVEKPPQMVNDHSPPPA